MNKIIIIIVGIIIFGLGGWFWFSSGKKANLNKEIVGQELQKAPSFFLKDYDGKMFRRDKFQLLKLQNC